MQKRVHVAVGVIINTHQQILLALRHGHLHQGGKWEFPGGKVEAGETVTQALTRELAEEVNLTVDDSSPFMNISHDYPDKQVRLDIHLVTQFSGNATGLEGQQIKWVDINQLNQYEFPEANKPILAKVLLQFAK
ncbi:8-oxo-dGTP diphosphatase MutT [Shewanella intestini]|uniref:8-oxo-dGTP diphosphatase n=1 Tax=Shewanella intestini TaxID=2017544 RepID=A0ABS5I525_9GAMM|nr:MULTISPECIES: 8-oxo-dGTP diphosphatase MutT [Shewanella]MBR9729132.1 8-oxo-dGTP diphosphatase MutT [Shewanella intestini]MRG37208.1 8-oxo-dGTP diphosphatase MutT [Shewanella sp. XMDDZSB0408]